MTTYQQYFARFSTGATAPAFSINASNITLTAGYYYMMGYTSEATNQLCEHITDKINDVISGSTCTYGYSTGLISLDFNSTVTAVTWADTALRDLLGFTGNLSGRLQTDDS
jgi:hypothetical protein